MVGSVEMIASDIKPLWLSGSKLVLRKRYDDRKREPNARRAEANSLNRDFPEQGRPLILPPRGEETLDGWPAPRGWTAPVTLCRASHERIRLRFACGAC